jgi:serine/threonine-protein kinase
MTNDTISRLNAALEDRYQVERELGEGGMATVYLAQDLKHNRSVALKVLKPELAAVVGAERFLAEIEVTANLQHPHILPLHDSGEADGFLYYVMPYIEGETLRDRLDRERQLPVDEAVKIVTDLAEALDYAHRRDVVHRDVKPANILMHEGRPLMADFGIALAVGSAGGARLTETGLSLGTPFYMSPEQATGDNLVGPASDTYALGCVLFEMLVGEPPYPGATAQAVLGKIIQGKPVSATEVRPTIPLNVDAAIRCALERLPADRFATAKEFAEALADPSFRHGAVGEAPPGALPPGPWPAIGAVSTVVAAVAVGVALWTATRPAPPRPVERFVMPQPQDATWLTTPSLAIAPDGSSIVLLGVDETSAVRLYVRTLDNLDTRALEGTEGAHHPILSPDGQEVAFFAQSALSVTNLQGGLVRELTEGAACCGYWDDDGYVYYAGTDWSIYRVAASGGSPELVVAKDDADLGFFQPLPGGSSGIVSAFGTQPRVERVDLESGERHVLVPGVRGISTPSGHLVSMSLDGQILAAPFDARSGELLGNSIPMVDGIWVSPGGDPFVALSPEGSLVYWAGGLALEDFQLVWVNRSGQSTLVDPDWIFQPGIDNRSWAVSPDGRRLALKVLTDLGNDIWIKELPDGPLSRLTFDEAEDRFPRWSPDGRSITFISPRGGNLDVWTKPADGTGEAELLVDLERTVAEAFWGPDGETLVLRTGGTSGVIGGRDILAYRPGTDSVPVSLVDSEFDEAAPMLSPDGRWLAYHSDETGRREVFIRPFPDVDQGKWQVSDNGGRQPVWSADGNELFYVTGGSGTFGRRDMMVAEIETGPPFAIVRRHSLFSLSEGYYFANNSRSYELAPDGERFLMARVIDTEEDPSQLILVQNWFTELEARVRP